jgi:hypothetical protein
MADTVSMCPDSAVHKLRAYPQESDLLSLSLSDHRFADDMPNYGSNVFLGKHAAAPRNERQTGALDQK